MKKRRGKAMGRIFSILGVLLFGLLVLGSGVHCDADLPKAKLELTSMTEFVSSLRYRAIVGELINKGEANARFVEVIGTWYDGDEVVGTSFSFTLLDIVRPGERSPFKIVLLKAGIKATRYKVQWQWENTTEEPHRDVAVLSSSARLNELGYLEVIGEVENQGNSNAEYVQIIGSFYDEEGEIVDADFTFASVDTIPPDGTSPFQLILLNKTNSALVESYRLMVQVD